jgi:hypothetical protein
LESVPNSISSGNSQRKPFHRERGTIIFEFVAVGRLPGMQVAFNVFSFGLGANSLSFATLLICLSSTVVQD